MSSTLPAVWFPNVRAGTGTDVFTQQLCDGLNARGIRAEITWLPHRAEYLPWTVPVPKPPAWANLVHVNTWLHERFIPGDLPVVATLHHSIHDPALRPYKGFLRAAYHDRWIAPIERRVMQRAQRVIAVSQFAADMGRRTLCDVPIEVIHNGIDTTRFSPPSQERVPGQPFRLLYVGGWMSRKGVDLLAPIMRNLGDEFELFYTGGLAAEREKKNMPQNMRDTGRLDSDGVVRVMQRVDALLFPSRSEGFGLVAAEAMACGLPVVATRGSSLPELVTDGITGFLCERDRILDFSDAVRKLVSDPAMAASMSVAAAAEARLRFGVENMVKAYQDLYHKIIRANEKL